MVLFFLSKTFQPFESLDQGSEQGSSWKNQKRNGVKF